MKEFDKILTQLIVNILVVILFYDCNSIDCLPNIERKNDKIFISNNDWKLLFDDYLIEPLPYGIPSVITDCGNSILYFAEFNSRIVALDLNNGEVKHTFDLSTFEIYKKVNIKQIDGRYVLLETDRNLILLNEKLQFVENLLIETLGSKLKKSVMDYFQYSIKDNLIRVEVMSTDELYSKDFMYRYFPPPCWSATNRNKQLTTSYFYAELKA